MNSQVLPEILKNVFRKLTKNVSPEKFFNWYDFNATAIEISPGTKIGIGINSDATAIKLFIIVTTYGEGDYRNFRQTFRIGFPKGETQSWSVELAQTILHSSVGDFDSLFQHMVSTNQIMKKIRQEEANMLSEEGLIKNSLSKHKGKRKDVANELGISERTLYSKIKLYELE